MHQIPSFCPEENQPLALLTESWAQPASELLIQEASVYFSQGWQLETECREL